MDILAITKDEEIVLTGYDPLTHEKFEEIVDTIINYPAFPRRPRLVLECDGRHLENIVLENFERVFVEVTTETEKILDEVKSSMDKL